MQINVSGHQVAVTPALRDYAAGKLERLRGIDRLVDQEPRQVVQDLRIVGDALETGAKRGRGIGAAPQVRKQKSLLHDGAAHRIPGSDRLAIASSRNRRACIDPVAFFAPAQDRALRTAESRWQ